MGKLLYNILDLFANNSFRSLLTSLGIGLVSATAVQTLLSEYINTALNQASSMPMLGLLGMFGIDSALSILLGAVLTRASIEASKLSLGKRA